MAELERTRVREREKPEQDVYEEVMKRSQGRAQRNAMGRIVCRLGGLGVRLRWRGGSRFRFVTGRRVLRHRRQRDQRRAGHQHSFQHSESSG